MLGGGHIVKKTAITEAASGITVYHCGACRIMACNGLKEGKIGKSRGHSEEACVESKDLSSGQLGSRRISQDRPKGSLSEHTSTKGNTTAHSGLVDLLWG